MTDRASGRSRALSSGERIFTVDKEHAVRSSKSLRDSPDRTLVASLTTVRVSPERNFVVSSAGGGGNLGNGRANGRAQPTLNLDKILVSQLMDKFRPFFIIFLVYGIVPLRLNHHNRLLRLSLHPFKSSLLYMLLVQVVVSVSAFKVLLKHFKVINRDALSADGLDRQLLAALSTMHVSSHFIMLLLAVELPFLKRRMEVWNFPPGLGPMLSGLRLSPVTRALPWLAYLNAFFLDPVMVHVWNTFIMKDPPWYVQGPAHLYQAVFITTGCLLGCFCCLLLCDVANNVAQKMRQELVTLGMSPGRLGEFRSAWLSMRELTSNVSALPVTALGMLLYHLFMITLSAYQCVVSFCNGYWMLFAASLVIFVLFETTLLGTCDTAHRLTEVMSKAFYEALEARAWRGMSEDLRLENQQFLQTISDNGPQVALAGFVKVSRATFLSVNATVATYLIVLFQLRQSDDTPSRAALNSSSIALDPDFGAV